MSKILTTPKGKAVYPYLDTADTKFNDNGLYSVKLHVDEGSFNSFKLVVDDLYNAAYEQEKTRRGKPKLRKASSSPLRITDEGDFEIYAKQEAQKMTKTKGLLKFNVVAFNAAGDKIKMPPVGGGSELALAVEPNFWYVDSQGFGYTLRLKAVQIIDLVEKTGGDMSGVFASVEGFSGGETFTDELTNDAQTQTGVSKETEDDFSF